MSHKMKLTDSFTFGKYFYKDDKRSLEEIIYIDPDYIDYLIRNNIISLSVDDLEIIIGILDNIDYCDNLWYDDETGLRLEDTF